MNNMRCYKPKEIEAAPLARTIMVHKSMIYVCECCGQKFKFFLEKGLEDENQDELNPKGHKPVPFTAPCLCGGTLVHKFWGMDESFDYMPLEENENYFENTMEHDCGISHIRNRGMCETEHDSALLELAEIFAEREKAESLSKEMAALANNGFDEDDPYGLAHISTTTLKRELRRRKGLR